jgi:hypothetical protein
MSRKISRQRIQQIRNNEAGMCQFHSHEPIFKSKLCEKCHSKQKKRYAQKSRELGRKKQKPSDRWDKVDFSVGPRKVAWRMKVGYSVALRQAVKRGWQFVPGNNGVWVQDVVLKS